MNKIKLSEICDIQSGGTPSRQHREFWDGGIIPWVKIGDFNGKYIDSTTEKISEDGLKGSSAKLFAKGTILYTIFATLGEVAILNINATTNQAIAGITLRDKHINNEYLYYYLKSLKSYVNRIGRGVAQNNINMSILRNFEMPVYALDKQKNIAEVLGIIEGVIVARRQQLTELDTLVKARFVEMFGDPDINPMNWPIQELGTVISSITSGWSANGEARLKKDYEKAVLKVSAVTQGFFKPDEYKVIPDDVEIKKYVYPQKGDLLFSRANTRELVGATVIIEKDYPDLLLPDKLWKVLFTDKIDVYYAKYILSTPAIRKVFSAQSTGTSGSMYNVSIDKFRNTLIPVPPTQIQRDFALFVTQVNQTKTTIQQTLTEAQTLFDSLMQQYFG